MKVLTNTEYAGALKETLLARRDGSITQELDTQLGLFLQNITRWAICELVKKGKLWRTLSTDEDFQCEILATVCSKLDRLDLSREPKEIIVYLKTAAQNRCRNYVRDMNRDKRRGDLVDIIECDKVTDMYGNRIN